MSRDLSWERSSPPTPTINRWCPRPAPRRHPTPTSRFRIENVRSSVAPGAGDPTGTVTVSDGTRACTVTLTASSAGSGSCRITEKSAGGYSFTASYGADTNFSSSATSAATSVTVGKALTTTKITSTTPKPVVGEAITVSVTVAAVAPGAGDPTGKVTVSNGTQTCTVTLTAPSAGKGSCKITEKAPSKYSLTATYPGDANFGSSKTSAATVVTVGKALTTTKITSTTLKPVVGEAITVTVTVAPVAPGAGDPTGKVTVSDGTQTCKITLTATSAGKGSCKITEKAAGKYSFTASYLGDANFGSSKTSAATVVTVGKAPANKATPPATYERASFFADQFAAGIFDIQPPPAIPAGSYRLVAVPCS